MVEADEAAATLKAAEAALKKDEALIVEERDAHRNRRRRATGRTRADRPRPRRAGARDQSPDARSVRPGAEGAAGNRRGAGDRRPLLDLPRAPAPAGLPLHRPQRRDHSVRFVPANPLLHRRARKPPPVRPRSTPRRPGSASSSGGRSADSRASTHRRRLMARATSRSGVLPLDTASRRVTARACSADCSAARTSESCPSPSAAAPARR